MLQYWLLKGQSPKQKKELISDVAPFNQSPQYNCSKNATYKELWDRSLQYKFDCSIYNSLNRICDIVNKMSGEENRFEQRKLSKALGANCD